MYSKSPPPVHACDVLVTYLRYAGNFSCWACVGFLECNTFTYNALEIWVGGREAGREGGREGGRVGGGVGGEDGEGPEGGTEGGRESGWVGVGWMIG